MSLEVKQNEEKSSSDDAAESLGLIKLVEELGYPEEDARKALRRASNKVELAIKYLLDGSAASASDEAEQNLSDVALRRRTRRRYKQLRTCLMDNPAINDYAVAALLKKPPHSVDALRDIVANHSSQFIESMLESSSDEEQAQP